MNALEQAGDGRQARAQQLAQRKDAMDAKVADLQQQLEKLANETRRDEKDASRKLDEAAGSIRDKKIREMIRYSKATLQGAGSQYARGMEDTIGTNLEALQKKIADAAGAMGKSSKQDAMARAADKARDLVRGMESLDQRMRDRSPNGRNQQGSQNGQNGQRSQQNGQQGQPGQQGQQAKRVSRPQDSKASKARRVPGSQVTGSQGSQGVPRTVRTRRAVRMAAARTVARPMVLRLRHGRTGGGYFRQLESDDVLSGGGIIASGERRRALRRPAAASGVSQRELDEIIRDLRIRQRAALRRVRAGSTIAGGGNGQTEEVRVRSARKRNSGNDSLSLSGPIRCPMASGRPSKSITARSRRNSHGNYLRVLPLIADC